MDQWGTSTNGARSSNGSRTFHLELEEKLATLSDGTEGKAINTAKPRVNTGTMLTPTGYSNSGGTIKLA